MLRKVGLIIINELHTSKLTVAKAYFKTFNLSSANSLSTCVNVFCSKTCRLQVLGHQSCRYKNRNLLINYCSVPNIADFFCNFFVLNLNLDIFHLCLQNIKFDMKRGDEMGPDFIQVNSCLKFVLHSVLARSELPSATRLFKTGHS